MGIIKLPVNFAHHAKRNTLLSSDDAYGIDLNQNIFNGIDQPIYKTTNVCDNSITFFRNKCHSCAGFQKYYKKLFSTFPPHSLVSPSQLHPPSYHQSPHQAQSYPPHLSQPTAPPISIPTASPTAAPTIT